MKVLVTGGAGYIGSHVCLELLDQGIDVVVADNLSSGFMQLVDPRATFFKIDIGSVPDVTHIIRDQGIDSIIHMAAKLSVNESVHDPALYYYENVGKSAALIKAVADTGVRNLVFSSTAAVYGMSDHDVLDEETTLNPLSPYGKSKKMVEDILMDVQDRARFNIGILRYFNVIGADPALRSGQINRSEHILRACLDVVAGRKECLNVFGSDYATNDGTGVRDYIHVSDLAAAHRFILKEIDRGRNIVANVGYGTGYSVLQVIAAVEKVTGVKVPVSFSPRREGDVARAVASNSRIRSTGWSPHYNDLAFAIKTALEWEQKVEREGLR